MFKTAKVKPVFTKGCSTNVNNYHPIGLLPAMSKILEKVMYKCIMSFLTKEKLFYDGQFGFKKNKELIMLAPGLWKTLQKPLKINN